MDILLFEDDLDAQFSQFPHHIEAVQAAAGEAGDGRGQDKVNLAFPAQAEHLLKRGAGGLDSAGVGKDSRRGPAGIGGDSLLVVSPLRVKDGVRAFAAGNPAVSGDAEPGDGAGSMIHVKSLLSKICPFLNFKLTAPLERSRMAEVIWRSRTVSSPSPGPARDSKRCIRMVS